MTVTISRLYDDYASREQRGQRARSAGVPPQRHQHGREQCRQLVLRRRRRPARPPGRSTGTATEPMTARRRGRRCRHRRHARRRRRTARRARPARDSGLGPGRGGRLARFDGGSRGGGRRHGRHHRRVKPVRYRRRRRARLCRRACGAAARWSRRASRMAIGHGSKRSSTGPPSTSAIGARPTAKPDGRDSIRRPSRTPLTKSARSAKSTALRPKRWGCSTGAVIGAGACCFARRARGPMARRASRRS